MARIITTGWEYNQSTLTSNNSDHAWADVSLTGTPTIVAGGVVGSYCHECNDSAGNTNIYSRYGSLATAHGYFRFWFKIDRLPTSGTRRIWLCASATSQAFSLIINASGSGSKLYGDAQGTTFGTTLTSVPVDKWVCVTGETYYNGASSVFQFNVFGESATSNANLTAGNWTVLLLGVGAGTAGQNCVVQYDDVAINDATGSNDNGLPPVAHLAYLYPTADNTVGNWTDGASGSGGSADIFEGINNRPPTGGGGGANDTISYDCSNGAGDATFDFQTYASKGIRDSDRIHFVQLWSRTGEAATAGTKAGRHYISANPDLSATVDTFNFGNNAGSAGTEIGNWRTAKGTIAYSPTIVVGTAPTALVGYTGTVQAYIVLVDGMEIIVEFTPRPLIEDRAPNTPRFEQTKVVAY